MSKPCAGYSGAPAEFGITWRHHISSPDRQSPAHSTVATKTTSIRQCSHDSGGQYRSERL